MPKLLHLSASPRGLIGANSQGIVQIDPITGQTRFIGFPTQGGGSSPIGVIGNEASPAETTTSSVVIAP